MKYLKYFENKNYDFSHTSKYINNPNLDGLNIPEKVEGYFKCNNSQLISLKFCPEYVGDFFDCSYNKLTSLEFCPKYVGSNFWGNYNELTSLEFGPKHVGGFFDCSYNKLTSLEFCPEYVGGSFSCNQNNWINPIPFEVIKKHNIEITNLYTDEQKEKFGKYEYQKEFLTNTPEKYKDLEPIGYNKKIKEEFDWLFNASDMGLM